VWLSGCGALDQGHGCPSVADAVAEGEAIDQRGAAGAAAGPSLLDGDIQVVPGGTVVLSVEDEQEAATEDDGVAGELVAVAVDGGDKFCGVAAVRAGDAAGDGELADDFNFEPVGFIGADGLIERDGREGRRRYGLGAGGGFVTFFAHDWGDTVGGVAEECAGGEEIIVQTIAALGWVIAKNLAWQFGDDQVAALALGAGWHDAAFTGAAHPETGIGTLAEDAVASIKKTGLKDGMEAEFAERINVGDGLFGFEALLLCPESGGGEVQDGSGVGERVQGRTGERPDWRGGVLKFGELARCWSRYDGTTEISLWLADLKALKY